MRDYEEMQKAIDQAWQSTDPTAIAFQNALFPAGKPSVEEFISVVAQTVENAQKRAL